MSGKLTKSMEEAINLVNETFANDKITTIFQNAVSNTYNTTMQKNEDGTTFVITGDIPAMWLRDSAAQVRPYLILGGEDEEILNSIKGVIQLQFKQILIDPYANAFNETANGAGYVSDLTEMHPQVWERKYEIDSLCYPLQLAYLYWKTTNDTSIFDETFKTAANKIIKLWKIEQHHLEQSPYNFRRVADWLLFEEQDRIIYETLRNNGKGRPVNYTGMTWSGFRPSDDACQFHYLVPSNMFAVVVLNYLEEIAQAVLHDDAIAQEARILSDEIDKGIKEFAIIEHEEFGKVFAYEVDGCGNYLLMDDANVPSLLAAPYLGYCDFDDEIYQNTRRMLLSKTNPFYYEGEVAKGIGSPHTPPQYIWHISMAIQGLTALTEEEKLEMLSQFLRTDAETGMMHEGFDVNNPNNFTRPWFSWANQMFVEFILSLCHQYVYASPLYNKNHK
ncbi:MAG: glycoside hydrolase family 125 protein [Turicibacter sp.]